LIKDVAVVFFVDQGCSGSVSGGSGGCLKGSGREQKQQKHTGELVGFVVLTVGAMVPTVGLRVVIVGVPVVAVGFAVELVGL
jgi:hypothetical protein